jgi:hypothetical protein
MGKPCFILSVYPACHSYRSSNLRLTPPEPDFTPGDKGFDDKDPTGQFYDLLGRKALGQQLSELIERIDQPLVIAFDGAWGSGKSHFLKLWTGAHRKENKGTAKVIYFDAFQHDYLDDPLVGLVGAILQEPPEESWSGKAIGNVKSAASKLLRPIARIGLAVGTAGASELAVAAIDPLVDALGKEGEKAIDALWAKEASRKNAMQQFRDALTALAQDAEGKPQKIVFTIDELDRCRPDYALGLLEVIKHFFAVPNVHFVLGTNLNALGNSVKSRYGEGINGALYLQKFIHLTMGFPPKIAKGSIEPWESYFDYVCNSLGLSDKRADEAKRQLKYYNETFSVSLRDTERLGSYLAIASSEFDKLEWGYHTLLTSALIIKIVDPMVYTALRSSRITKIEIENLFSLSKRPHDNDYSSIAFYHCWRYILNDPGKDTMDFIKDAFGRLNNRVELKDINNFITRYLEAFSLPEP